MTYFVDLPGDLYTHWSLLCQYDGTIGGTPASGLCTLEYATGIGMHSISLPGNVNLPVPFFSYHVLNIDDRTQVLTSKVATEVYTRRTYWSIYKSTRDVLRERKPRNRGMQGDWELNVFKNGS